MKHLITETAEALTKFLLSIELQDFIMYEEAWQKLDACMQAYEASPNRHTIADEEALEDANTVHHMLTLYACHRDALIMARRYSNADTPRTTRNPAEFLPVVMDTLQDRCTWELDPIGIDVVEPDPEPTLVIEYSKLNNKIADLEGRYHVLRNLYDETTTEDIDLTCTEILEELAGLNEQRRDLEANTPALAYIPRYTTDPEPLIAGEYTADELDDDNPFRWH